MEKITNPNLYFYKDLIPETPRIRSKGSIALNNPLDLVALNKMEESQGTIGPTKEEIRAIWAKSSSTNKVSSSLGFLTKLSDVTSKAGHTFLAGSILFSSLAYIPQAYGVEKVHSPTQIAYLTKTDKNNTEILNREIRQKAPSKEVRQKKPSIETKQIQRDKIYSDSTKPVQTGSTNTTAIRQESGETIATRQINTTQEKKTSFGIKLAETAAQYAGKHYKKGMRQRCADFVSTMIELVGAPKNFEHVNQAAALVRFGSKVGQNELQPGDLVFFKNTYTKGPYTHVGIYIGDGQFVHRPTASKPVRVERIDSGYWLSHFSAAIRLGVN